MKRLGFSLLPFLFASTLVSAQTVFPEVEPNGGKPEATLVGGMVAGDAITGLSTGNITTAGATFTSTADMFRVKTAALPLGIYKHRLTLTTATSAVHTGNIRGLQQGGTPGVGGTVGTFDLGVQISTVAPGINFNQWYGFGKQEEIYYRVVGDGATSAAYSATLSTVPLVATPIPGTFSAGPVRISTVGLTFANTDLCLFDATFDAIPGASNNDEGPVIASTQSRLTRCLTPGTYYLCLAGLNTTTNLPAPADDFNVIDTLMDFPGSVVYSSSTSGPQDWDFSISDGVNAATITNQLPSNSFFEATWFSFTVGGAGTPPNDACANATVVTPGILIGDLGLATNDGVSSCDPGGAGAKDVWYSFTNGAIPVNMSLETCASVGVDTAIAVYSGCGGSELACSDDCGGFPCGGPASCLSVPLAAAQTVLIRVSDKALSGGCFSLNLAIAPTNDECNSPIVLPAPGVFAFDTTFSTTGSFGQSTTSGCLSSVKRDLWYAYTATTNGTATVSTCGGVITPSVNTKIAVYAGLGCPFSVGLACNDDALAACPSNPTESILSFATVCGVTYLIQLGSLGTMDRIAGTFSVAETGSVCSTPSVSFCSGDGTGATCPCGNFGAADNGCASSAFAAGAHLSSAGQAGASAPTDSLVITASNVAGPGLFFQGTGQFAGGAGIPFGDGLLCAGGTILRLGVVFPTGNAAAYPGGLTPNPIHVAGATAAGDLRHYQCWYRDAIAFCSSATYNLTQGLSLTWSP